MTDRQNLSIFTDQTCHHLLDGGAATKHNASLDQETSPQPEVCAVSQRSATEVNKKYGQSRSATADGLKKSSNISEVAERSRRPYATARTVTDSPRPLLIEDIPQRRRIGKDGFHSQTHEAGGPDSNLRKPDAETALTERHATTGQPAEAQETREHQARVEDAADESYDRLQTPVNAGAEGNGANPEVARSSDQH